MIYDIIMHSEEEFKEKIKKGERVETQYGVARLGNNGYYYLWGMRSLLHRIFFEDYYGIFLPENYVVRFIDGNKRNICVENLQAVERRVFDRNNSKKMRLKRGY